MDGITDAMDMRLGKLQVLVMDREALFYTLGETFVQHLTDPGHLARGRLDAEEATDAVPDRTYPA